MITMMYVLVAPALNNYCHSLIMIMWCVTSTDNNYNNWGEPERAPYGIEKRPPRTIYLSMYLCICSAQTLDLGQSMDCLAQSVDRPLSTVCARQSMDCTSSRRGKSEAQAHRCEIRDEVQQKFCLDFVCL